MIGILKDLPDWATGSVAAGALWFSGAYGVLAPRAMEADVERDVLPSCVEQLEAEQDRVLARETEYREEERTRKIDEASRQLRARERDLREIESAIMQARTLQGMMDDSGIGMFMPRVDHALPSAKDLERAKAQVAQAREALTNIPEITLPRLPSSALMETCSCAALETLAGRRTDYAISLASFRLVNPSSIASVKSDMTQALRWNGCGGKPWEQL